MAHSDPFNVATPDGTDDPRDGDDRIRELKRAIKERVTLGGMFWDSGGSPDDNAGKIACGVIATNKWYVYETDKTAIAIDLDDSAKTLTLGDGIDGSVSYTMVADVGNFGDLVITGDITTPNLDRPVISGGTSGREHTFDFNLSGLLVDGAGPHVIITTSASIESSTHASPPTRTFLCTCTANYSVHSGISTCDGMYMERKVGAGSWSTTGFVAGQSGSFAADRIGNISFFHDNITFTDILNLATTAEQIEFRFVVDDISSTGTGLTVSDIHLTVWEMFSAAAT